MKFRAVMSINYFFYSLFFPPCKQEEENRKKKEELLIQRQKRIAERSAASGGSATIKRTPPAENKYSTTSKKTVKSGNQSAAKESANFHKPVFRSSTMDRLATVRTTKSAPSTQTKSGHPKKEISKANGTATAMSKKTAGAENKKLSASKVKPSDKQNGLNFVNEVFPCDPDFQGNKDCMDSTAVLPIHPDVQGNKDCVATTAALPIDPDVQGNEDCMDTTAALPTESTAAQVTQNTEAKDDCKDIKELCSIPSTEKNEDIIAERSNLDDEICNVNIIETQPLQPDHITDDEKLSKALPALCKDAKVPEEEGAHISGTTMHPTPPSPEKGVIFPSVKFEESATIIKNSRSSEISEIKISTPPPSELNTEPMHSRKKWNNDDNSPKAAKGFRKLLLFGRRNRHIYMA